MLSHTEAAEFRNFKGFGESSTKVAMPCLRFTARSLLDSKASGQ